MTLDALLQPVLEHLRREHQGGMIGGLGWNGHEPEFLEVASRRPL